MPKLVIVGFCLISNNNNNNNDNKTGQLASQGLVSCDKNNQQSYCTLAILENCTNHGREFDKNDINGKNL